MSKAKIQSVQSELVIREKTYKLNICQLKQSDLSFYSENPRVYSSLHESGVAPTQDEILELMKGLDHVLELRADIKKNGGLIEPLYVLESTLEVIEGNSRLAAYRLLAEENPVAWDKVKCAVLPKSIPESAIASLLGQLHLKGKKDWAPYEQASYLYRRHHKEEVSIPTLSVELNISEKEIRRKIDVVEKMLEYKDSNTAHWSHYDEMIKCRLIRKACDDQPLLEKTIVKLIKEDAIKAVDVRSKIKKICSAPTERPVKQLIAEKDVEEALKVAQTLGSDNTALQQIRKFRDIILRGSTSQSIRSSTGRVRGQLIHELRQIRDQIDRLLKNLKEEK
jgi:hypothetical protein